jgi:hypothetical protein
MNASENVFTSLHAIMTSPPLHTPRLPDPSGRRNYSRNNLDASRDQESMKNHSARRQPLV